MVLAVVLLIVGFEEEVRYRALAFRTLDQGVGSRLAMAISAAFFGLSHAANSGATPLGITAIAVGGVFLAACYLRYGTLWVPIAFHFAWNTTIGVLLGLPISGTEVPALLHADITGPELWTGGRFGPEASTALQPFIFAAAAFYLWRVIVEKKLTPAPWRARPEPGLVEPAIASAGQAPIRPSPPQSGFLKRREFVGSICPLPGRGDPGDGGSPARSRRVLRGSGVTGEARHGPRPPARRWAAAPPESGRGGPCRARCWPHSGSRS